MRNVLITGSSGQLGRSFRKLSNAHPEFRFHFFNREDLPLEKPELIREKLNAVTFDVLINCAAYTKVDLAETEQTDAYLINCEAVGHLADVCQDKGAILVHYSSDYVYHNGERAPMQEDAPLNPRSVYAKSKLCGELAAIANCERTLLFRTSWLYSPYGHNFVKTMLRLGSQPGALTVVDDQIGAPTYAPDLAKATLEVLGKLLPGSTFEESSWGVYNYANRGQTSWFGFASGIMQIAGLAKEIHPIPTSGYPTPAPRPPYSVMDMSRVINTFGIHIPEWKVSLRSCLEELGAAERTTK